MKHGSISSFHAPALHGAQLADLLRAGTTRRVQTARQNVHTCAARVVQDLVPLQRLITIARVVFSSVSRNYYYFI